MNTASGHSDLVHRSIKGIHHIRRGDYGGAYRHAIAERNIQVAITLISPATQEPVQSHGVLSFCASFDGTIRTIKTYANPQGNHNNPARPESLPVEGMQGTILHFMIDDFFELVCFAAKRGKPFFQ